MGPGSAGDGGKLRFADPQQQMLHLRVLEISAGRGSSTSPGDGGNGGLPD